MSEQHGLVLRVPRPRVLVLWVSQLCALAFTVSICVVVPGWSLAVWLHVLAIGLAVELF